MTAWTTDEPGTIANAAELQIAPLRPDGTPRNPVTVPNDDDLYVRSYRCADGSRKAVDRTAVQLTCHTGDVDVAVAVGDP
jgi:hypothetical protein